MKPVYGIGIESSCDETGVALVKDGIEIISNPLFSQINLHTGYGGVIPELASRSHLEKIPFLVGQALSDLHQAPDYIAVTVKPGLAGSLLVGYNTALALSDFYQVPLIPVHHLEAHFHAVSLDTGQMLNYPFLGLLVSGGNSALYRVDGPGQISVLGDTRDDAAGEALDKAASLLSLPYPGGPHIEKAAAEAGIENMKNPLPVVLRDQPADRYEFSFSGLKTALLYLLQKEPDQYSTAQIAAFFQERLFEIFFRNTRRVLKNTDLKTMIAAGGVTANRYLRAGLEKITVEAGVEFHVPPLNLCTDNGAMIAAAGYASYRQGNIPRQYHVSSDNRFSFTALRER